MFKVKVKFCQVIWHSEAVDLRPFRKTLLLLLFNATSAIPIGGAAPSRKVPGPCEVSSQCRGFTRAEDAFWAIDEGICLFFRGSCPTSVWQFKWRIDSDRPFDVAGSLPQTTGNSPHLKCQISFAGNILFFSLISMSFSSGWPVQFRFVRREGGWLARSCDAFSFRPTFRLSDALVAVLQEAERIPGLLEIAVGLSQNGIGELLFRILRERRSIVAFRGFRSSPPWNCEDRDEVRSISVGFFESDYSESGRAKDWNARFRWKS